MPTKTPYYLLEYNNFTTRGTLSNNNISITNDLINIFNHVFSEKKPKNKIIYFYDLGSFDLLMQRHFTMQYSIKNFKYNNKYYVMEITEVFFPNSKTICKDLYNFFSAEMLTKILSEDFFVLNTFYKEIKDSYNINLNVAYILSTPSLSMHIFKKRFPEQAKKIVLLQEKEYNYIKKAYYGGRNEVFKSVVKKNYTYDVNSLYPFIMKSCLLPVGESSYLDNTSLLTRSLEDIFGFLDVTIAAPVDIMIPILPYRSNNALGILYPRGIFRGVYFSEELKLALLHGYKIIEYHSAYEYLNKSILFDHFVDDLYQKRVNTSSAILKDTYKKILNSLYGRFGLQYDKVEQRYQKNTTEFISQTAYTVYNDISITAAIASYARIHMYSILSKYKDFLVYIDTDGIVTLEKLHGNFVTTDKTLGSFRLESENDAGYFFGCKMYLVKVTGKKAFDYVFKGVPLENKIVNISELIDAICHNNNFFIIGFFELFLWYTRKHI